MRINDYKFVKFGLYRIREAKTIDRVVSWAFISTGIILIILLFASIKVEINKTIILPFAIIPTVLLIYQFIRNVDKDSEIIIGYIEFNYDSIKIFNNKVLTEYNKEDVQSLKVVFDSIKGESKAHYGSVGSYTENGLFNEFYLKLDGIKIQHDFIILSKAQLIILKKILESWREDNSNIVFKKVSGNNLLVYDKKDWLH